MNKTALIELVWKDNTKKEKLASDGEWRSRSRLVLFSAPAKSLTKTLQTRSEHRQSPRRAFTTKDRDLDLCVAIARRGVPVGQAM